MKKLIFLFISIALLLAACGDKPEKNKKETEISKTENEQGLEVDKGLLNVEVVIPASMLDEEVDIDQLKAEVKEKGIKDVKINDDGSATYKMSKSAHKKWLKESADELDQTLTEMVESGDFESIKDITANKNYTEFTITVDAQAFENSFDSFAIFGVGLSGMFYQVLDGVNPEKYNVIINIIDESGEKIDTVVFPDNLDEDTDE